MADERVLNRLRTENDFLRDQNNRLRSELNEIASVAASQAGFRNHGVFYRIWRMAMDANCDGAGPGGRRA